MTSEPEKLYILGLAIDQGLQQPNSGEIREVPIGIANTIRNVGLMAQARIVESLGSFVSRVAEELDASLGARNWTANVRIQVGVGPDASKIAGEVSIQLSNTSKI